MKTVDLIPFILLELYEKDQYGLEITKNIENKTNGKVIIKQPTLYTVLKKLEKSKFITSYWLDSEIGGKRHYYKLTDFGKIQVSTLPTFAQLLTALENEDEADLEETQALNDSKPQPLETILSSDLVFNNEIQANPIDVATESDINLQNAEVLKSCQNDEDFANNTDIAKFTETNPTTNNINLSELQNNLNNNLIPEIEFTTPVVANNNAIKYVDYKNIKKDEKNIYSKNIAKKILFKNIFTSLTILIVLMIFNLITKATGTSPVYYVFWITLLIFAIFYPIVTLCNLEKIKTKYAEKTYQPHYKKRIYINLFVILIVIISLLFLNIGINNNSFIKIFSINNFENFYAPILLSCSGLIDVLITRIIFKKSN